MDEYAIETLRQTELHKLRVAEHIKTMAEAREAENRRISEKQAYAAKMQFQREKELAAKKQADIDAALVEPMARAKRDWIIDHYPNCSENDWAKVEPLVRQRLIEQRQQG